MRRGEPTIPHDASREVKRAVGSLEAALLTRDEWLRLAAQGSELGLWYWNEQTQKLFWDRRTREIFGVNLEGDVNLDTFYEALHPDDLARVKQVWRSQLESGVPYALEYRARRPDGGVRWINARGSGYYTRTGKPLYMIGVHFDVTERKEAERERLALSGRLINAQERERLRLAREIHDDFCQRLSVLTVKLQTLGSMLKEADARALLDESIGIGAGLADDIRALAHQLHSSKLEVLGLVPSLDALCSEVAKEYGLNINFDPTDIPGPLSSDIALAIFRITQESLRNVVRHSGASWAEVHLHANSDEICVTIRDTGRGFDATRAHASQGIGVQSMQERAQMLGGRFNISSRPITDGTLVAVTLPWQSNQDAP